jgi:exodeoxyribonuclease VII small subunit
MKSQTKAKTTSYKKAIEELETIVEELENQDIQIDSLSEKIIRATDLIEFCENKLNGVEIVIKTAVKKINAKK